jgi:hypothetical protein
MSDQQIGKATMMKVIVDEKLFPLRLDSGRTLLQQTADDMNVEVSYSDIGSMVGLRNEVVAIAGLGIAVASLVVAVLQLIRTPKTTKAQFLEDAKRTLVANGLPTIRIEFNEGNLSNLLELNGKPTSIVIHSDASSRVIVYLGATKKELYVSSSEPNWRSLISD